MVCVREKVIIETYMHESDYYFSFKFTSDSNALRAYNFLSLDIYVRCILIHMTFLY